MSAPHESRHDDQQLVQYLLGLLPDEEAQLLEEMSVVDDEIASRLDVVEKDLVDAYVRRTMPDDTRERFESVYLSSPRRRQKVKFAESFLGVADRTAVPVDTDTAHASRAMPWRGLAIAAALVLVAGGALLFSELRVRNGLQEARNAGAALERRAHELEQRLSDQQAANAETAKELEGVRASVAALAQQPLVSPPPPMVALVLPPQTRGSGLIATMAVPRGADGVAFELQLDANDFPQYEVALRDPATDRIIWRSGRIAPRSDGDLLVVSVIVPAGELKSQQYSLELAGRGAAGGAQVVSSYPFRTVRR